ncbi:lipopolysaccharide biosynthesis protein [Anaerostipes sp. MSJ-23]|uniref:lipopolysaccharide biosynthesis protein n=1 Tax=Anaerostipes sp. MSJ-23 TaxID=2841520 RepID=UPI001C1196C2|nr:oligosaccharide flippase family protein [Anaerostipes sp. MSJ-23]MBU5459676.1 oligosaccharide flippase family protein [Anaerostipes sp. MSJ-23]
MYKKFKKIINMYLNLPIQVKASLWFVMSTVLLKGIAFITVPIFTRIMDTTQYGIYNVYLTWYEMFTIIGTFGLESCAYVSALTKFNEKDKNEAQASLLELSWVLTSILFVVFCILGDKISTILGLPKNLLLLMCLQIYFVPAVNFWSMRNRFQYKYKSLVFVSVSMAIFNALLGIVFVMNFGMKDQALGRVISIVAVQIIYGIVLLYKLLKNGKFIFSIKYWKWALELHLPLLPHTLSLKVLAGADKVMINAIIGATATALYSVSYSVAVVVNLIKTSIVDALRPWLYINLKEKNTNNIKEVINGILMLVTLLTLVFVAFAPEIIKIAAPANYYEAIYCMPPVMISSFFTFLYSVFSIVEMYYEETKKIMIASIVAAVLNVLLNAVFIKIFGYIAAAFTTLVCYIVLSITHYILANSVLKKNGVLEPLFDKKTIISISVGLIGLMFVFEYVYEYMLLRYVILIIMVIILYVKKAYFINLIKTIKDK